MVDPSGAIDFNSITATLQQYANILKPWSKSVALRMLSDVYNRDAKAWAQHGDEMGRALREEIETAPTGTVMQALLDSQVDLITSLPREAAQRVQKLATESRITGMRASELVSKILETGDVTLSRAQLIARTETARAASALTEARAKHVGSEGYIWRTAEDSDVRADHKKLNGKFIRWDDPPIADSHANVRAHAGTIYNCRCYSEPVIPD
jgi:SPP1 gp7 family putative phage head morphogenesis protein